MTPESCSACGARDVELRRGRCWGCYVAWNESREVGLGAACEACEAEATPGARCSPACGWCGACT